MQIIYFLIEIIKKLTSSKKLKEKHKIERPLLHAYRLEIDHPITGEHMAFEAPLSADMLRIARGIVPAGQEGALSFLQGN